MNNQFRFVGCQWVASAALALVLTACGGGGGSESSSSSPPPPAQKTISGTVMAPNGMLAMAIVGNGEAAQQPAELKGVPAALLASTCNRRTGCGPVSRKPVVLRTLQTYGPTYGPAIAQTTTNEDGGYTIALPTGTSDTDILVVTVGAASDVQMSNIVTGPLIDIDPTTEAAFQLLADYARRNNLTLISLEVMVQLVADVDVVATSLPPMSDTRTAINAYRQTGASSPRVSSTLNRLSPVATPVPTPVVPNPTLPAGFPSNLPLGSYRLSTQVCGNFIGCQPTTSTTIQNNDIRSFSNEIIGVFNSVPAPAGCGKAANYTAFNGSSFVATMTISCGSGASLVTTTIKITVTKI